jgi:serine phosphatase RsbU (regulator of sigma subunit)
MLAKELNNKRYMMNCYGIMAQCYEKLGNNSKMVEYYNLFSTLDQHLKNEQVKTIQKQSQHEVNQAIAAKKHTEKQLDQRTEQLIDTKDSLKTAERITREQKMKLEISELKRSEATAKLKNERLKNRFFLIGLIVVLIFLSLLFLQFRQIKKANAMLALKNEQIARQNQQINDSISYGVRLQEAILPLEETLNRDFESFIFFRPKDKVSGDFYWYKKMEYNGSARIYVAAVDCTGHGVPGGLMSMIGNSLLNEIVSVKEAKTPSEILQTLSKEVVVNLKQEQSGNTDGMDVCLCLFEPSGNKMKLTFAGAKRPLFYYNSSASEVETIDGDRNTIGGSLLSETNKFEFNNKTLMLSRGDVLFLTSDGIIDQNNPERKRFGSKRFVEFIQNTNQQSMIQQKESLQQMVDEHRQNEEQRDDMVVIGLKIKT